jgi:MHS family proline/betaine transporter-like MFS transporter
MKQSSINISCLSNVLEWYDFGLFIFLAPIIGNNFFLSQTFNLATQDALLVLAIGFICRPLGGILYGHFGDTRGRAKVLRLSTLMITLSTLLIGFLPSYHTIGVSATVLFILMRVIQGMSIGGEYSGVMIYLAESSSAKKRGFYTSFAAVGANLGFLLATLSFVVLKIFLSEESINNWGWRLLFIAASLPGLIFVYYRFKLTETDIYLQLQNNSRVEKNPFLMALQFAPRQLLKIFFLTCMSASFYYVFFGYMPYYLSEFIGVSLNFSLTVQCFLLIAMVFLVPLGGFFGDYFGRKKMIILTALGVILFLIPCFYLLQFKSCVMIILLLSIATLLSSLDQGSVLTAVVDNCPANIRYTAMSFAYNLGNAVFGGTAPLLMSLLTEKVGPLMPAYYLIFMAIISLITATTILSNNKVEENLVFN